MKVRISGVDGLETRLQSVEAQAPTKGLVWTVSGKSLASEVYPGACPYAFTSSTTYSWASARVAATASTVYVVRRGATQVATITFAAGATVGIWSANVTWSAGSYVRIDAPATPDATLADIVFTAMPAT